MKPILKKCLTALVAVMCLTAAHAAGPEVYLRDYLQPGMAESDATPAVRAALERCAELKASKLILPGGRLSLRPDYGVERYQFISNNDEGLKHIAFCLENMHDFTVEGNGTELLFSGFVSPFSLSDCRNVTIRDLKIDYTRTFYSEGRVVAAGDGWLELQFPDDYVCEIVNGCLLFTDKQGMVYPFTSMLEFDGVRREPAFGVNDFWMPNRTVPVEKLANGNYRIVREDLRATPGNVVVFNAAMRSCSAFVISDCSGVTLQGVGIYHCGGMGVIAQRSRDLALNKVDVVPTPGSDRMVSATADATHFANCGGFIRITDCIFENMMDDASNIHGLYMAIEKVSGPDRLLLRWRHLQQLGADYIRPGMHLEMVDNQTMNTYARVTVREVDRLNRQFTQITLDAPLPAGVKPGHVVACDDDSPEVLISGCRMRGNRARGLLLGSRGRTVIENNYFHIAGASILLEGDGNYWFEQSGVRGLVVRNNIFENGNYGCPNWGRACITVGSGIPERKTCRYHRDIVVEGNTFRVFNPLIASLYCVDGFLFRRNNIVIPTTDYPYTQAEQRRFVYDDCDRVEIEN